MTSSYLSAPQATAALVAGFEAIRIELGVSDQFSTVALQEAHAAARIQPDAVDGTDVPFVTIDPESSMDLDQAVHIERVGPGYRVHYVIADVPTFVLAGSELDSEVRARGMGFAAWCGAADHDRRQYL